MFELNQDNIKKKINNMVFDCKNIPTQLSQTQYFTTILIKGAHDLKHHKDNQPHSLQHHCRIS